jgi:oxygen-independent coproporphyrinogen-3 oxidase
VEDIGLYVHIPFCRSRCAYCDFATSTGLDSLLPRYVAALRREIESWPDAPPVGSLYLGGGTPSLLTPIEVETIVGSVSRRFSLLPTAEITLEANPGDLDRPRLAELRERGVNRLSLGVQTFDDALLRIIGRRHDAAEAIAALGSARAVGFDNVSLDLIFGLPGQTLDGWRATLDTARNLAPEHLSLYCLTVESGTPLASWISAGTTTVPDDDAAAEMYEATIDSLAESYEHYEISNWARRDPRRDLRAQHNLRYWRNQPYIGVGAAAHSSFGGRRFHNANGPAEYIRRIEDGWAPVEADDTEVTTPDLAESETLMLGLRLAEGVERDSYRSRFGVDLASRHAATIAELAALGLVELTPGALRLTPRGRLLGNEVFQRFLS